MLGTSAPVRDEGSQERNGPVLEGKLGPLRIRFPLLSRPLFPLPLPLLPLFI